MNGPFPKGTYANLDPTTWERSLRRDRRYRVVKPFRDHDGAAHDFGEEWYFIGSSFLPYDDGLSVFVSDDGKNEWQIRLCWRPEDEGEICENFAEYVEAVEGEPRS